MNSSNAHDRRREYKARVKADGPKYATLPCIAKRHDWSLQWKTVCIHCLKSKSEVRINRWRGG